MSNPHQSNLKPNLPSSRVKPPWFFLSFFKFWLENMSCVWCKREPRVEGDGGSIVQLFFKFLEQVEEFKTQDCFIE